MTAEEVVSCIIAALLFVAAPAALCWHLGVPWMLVPYFAGMAWIAR